MKQLFKILVIISYSGLVYGQTPIPDRYISNDITVNGTGVLINSEDFNNNLDPLDDTVQKLADKFDTFSNGGSSFLDVPLSTLITDWDSALNPGKYHKSGSSVNTPPGFNNFERGLVWGQQVGNTLITFQQVYDGGSGALAVRRFHSQAQEWSDWTVYSGVSTGILFQEETRAGNLTNPDGRQQFATFTPHITGAYELNLAGDNIVGTAFIEVGTSVGGTDTFNGLVNGLADRIDATTPSKTYEITLIAETEYFIQVGTGGGSNVDDIRYSVRYKELDTEAQQTLSIVGSEITISNGNTISIPRTAGEVLFTPNTSISSGSVLGAILELDDKITVLEGSNTGNTAINRTSTTLPNSQGYGQLSVVVNADTTVITIPEGSFVSGTAKIYEGEVAARIIIFEENPIQGTLTIPFTTTEILTVDYEISN